MVTGKAIIGMVSILGMIGGGWLITNYEPLSVGVIAFALSLVALVVAVSAGLIARFFNTSLPSSDGAIGLKKQVWSSLLVGVPIGLNSAFGFTIGVPTLALSIATQSILTIFVFPAVEEVFFLFAVPFLLSLLLRKQGLFGVFLVFILTSAIFSAYHWAAYGRTTLVAGVFMGAFLFRLLTLIVVAWLSGAALRDLKFTPGQVGKGIVAAYLMHVIFNAYTITQSLSIIAEGG